MSNTPTVIPFCFESLTVRAIEIDGNPWFVAKDVCEVLDYKNPRQAISTHLDDDERGVQIMDTPSGDQEINIISESGLYTLIIRSNKPQAKPFRKWVTSEVLPAIRKTGGYQLRENDKRVFVNHNHKRGTDPHGIDIRYTMDLTKIAAHPTPAGLEIIERLTGIKLSDIEPKANSSQDSLANMFVTFTGAWCDIGEEYETSSLSLFRAFLSFCVAAGWHTGLPSVRRFLDVAAQHFKRGNGKVATLCGVRIRADRDRQSAASTGICEFVTGETAFVNWMVESGEVVNDLQASISFARLYTAFARFFRETVSDAPALMPTKIAVSKYLERMGYNRHKHGGTATVVGLKLKSDEEVAV